MSSLLRVALSAASIFIGACSASSEAPASSTSREDAEADAASLRLIVAQLDSAYSAEDFRAAARHFADDIVHMPPNQPAVVGLAAVRSRDSTFAATSDDELTSVIDDLVVSGDRAVIREHYTESWVARTGGPRTTVTGKTLLVFRKEADGTWKITHYMWNDSAPRS